MPDLSAGGPYAIVAFEGWNDAADAASGAATHVLKEWGSTEIASLDADRFYDFQVARPFVSMDESGARKLVWPNTRIYRTKASGRVPEVYVVKGIEPSTRWKEFCHELLEVLRERGVRTIICLGALLADAPHTRPIPVSLTSDHPELFSHPDIVVPTYEGPTGIVGVLSQFAAERGFGSVSMWAAVPHYVAQPPSPKVVLALLNRIEMVTGYSIDVHDLAQDALAWEGGVNELAESDPEIGDYVRQLEADKDTTELPEASGEAIAREFEQYLRRRDDGHQNKDDGGKA